METNTIKASSTTKKMELLDLNDDCILAILERMPPSELCEISFTCKKLKEMADDVFQRKHSNGWINTALASTNKYSKATDCTEKLAVEVSEYDEKYLKYFGKFIKNVRYAGVLSSEPIAEFLTSKCCKQLKSLDLHFYLRDSEDRGVLWDGLNKIIGTLEHFGINQIDDYNNDWMQLNFPALKSIEFDSRQIDTQLAKDFGEFLQRHQHIKEITCTGAEMLRAVLNNVKHIEKLSFISLANETNEQLINDLKKYFKQNPIKWFEYRFMLFSSDSPISTNEIELLIDLDAVQPINALDLGTCGEEEVLFRLKHLKQLYKLRIFYDCPAEVFETCCDKLSKEFPHLKDLRIRWCHESEFIELAMPFVKNSPNLEKLTFELDDEDTYAYSNDLLKLNAVRLEVRDAKPMTIEISLGDELELDTFVIPKNGLMDLKISTQTRFYF